ncbi:MAG: hypothetical protein EZS28_006661 [Streblomastix strix]|uniref:Uncharacterized protein n=1 Tax=Streblomastix strix TaxID=222440 RepID=A0A5J4WRV0_9EUKA|nr:MAG: hypothetical protein EZS28_006661 [Streblomastix strix]
MVKYTISQNHRNKCRWLYLNCWSLDCGISIRHGRSLIFSDCPGVGFGFLKEDSREGLWNDVENLFIFEFQTRFNYHAALSLSSSSLNLNSSQSKIDVVQDGLMIVLALFVQILRSDDRLGKTTYWEKGKNEVPNGYNILSLFVGDNISISPFGYSFIHYYYETFVKVES